MYTRVTIWLNEDHQEEFKDINSDEAQPIISAVEAEVCYIFLRDAVVKVKVKRVDKPFDENQHL